MTSKDLLWFGIVDHVIPELLGGAHRNHHQMATRLKVDLFRINGCTTDLRACLGANFLTSLARMTEPKHGLLSCSIFIRALALPSVRKTESGRTEQSVNAPPSGQLVRRCSVASCSCYESSERLVQKPLDHRGRPGAGNLQLLNFGVPRAARSSISTAAESVLIWAPDGPDSCRCLEDAATSVGHPSGGSATMSADHRSRLPERSQKPQGSDVHERLESCRKPLPNVR